MEIKKIAEGLWRWTAPHPEWTPEKEKPGGWWRMVGCLYYEPPEKEGRATVLIDPLAPPEGSAEAARFWEALDRDVARRGAPVAVLLANHYHERSAQAVLERYRATVGASLWCHEASRPRVRCAVTDTFSKEAALPGGVRACPVTGLDDGETFYWLDSHRTLVSADALIGTAPGRIRLAPAWWGPDTPEGRERYGREFRASLRRLLALPVERILVSHGEPVLERGGEALREALEAPAWGEG